MQLVLSNANTLNRIDFLIAQTSIVQMNDLLGEQFLGNVCRRPTASWGEQVVRLPWAAVVGKAGVFQAML